MPLGGLEQDRRLDPVAGSIRLLPDHAAGDGIGHRGDHERETQLLDPAIAVGEDLREVEPGVHVHHGERDACRCERLARQVEHDDRVLATREQEAGALHLRGDLAEDVDALGLQGAQLAQGMGGHSGAPGASSGPASASRRRTWATSDGWQTRRSGDHGFGPLYSMGEPSRRVAVRPAAWATATGAAEIPLVLAAGVEVDVHLALDRRDHLDAGGAHGHELDIIALGESPDDRGRTRPGCRDAQWPLSGDDCPRTGVRDGRDAGAVEDPAAAGERDRAGDQSAATLPEGDVDREVHAPGTVRVDLCVLPGAVERIDDPDAAGVEAGRVVLRLLGQHGVRRAMLRQGGGEPRLRCRISGGAECLAVEGHAVGPRALAQRHQDPSGAIGEGSREAGVVAEVGGSRRARVHALARHHGLPAIIRRVLLHRAHPRTRLTVAGPAWPDRSHHPRMSRTLHARQRGRARP